MFHYYPFHFKIYMAAIDTNLYGSEALKQITKRSSMTLIPLEPYDTCLRDDVLGTLDNNHWLSLLVQLYLLAYASS